VTLWHFITTQKKHPDQTSLHAVDGYLHGAPPVRTIEGMSTYDTHDPAHFGGMEYPDGHRVFYRIPEDVFAKLGHRGVAEYLHSLELTRPALRDARAYADHGLIPVTPPEV